MAYSASTFYCHNCADSLGLLGGLQPVSTAPSTYQHDKAVKHTQPAVLTNGAHSVLGSRSTAEYQSLEQQAFDRGFLEVEKSGTRTLILQSTGAVGAIYQNGALAGAADSFRRVLSTDSAKAHGYPDSSTNYAGIQCAHCSVSLTS